MGLYRPHCQFWLRFYCEMLLWSSKNPTQMRRIFTPITAGIFYDVESDT